MTTQFVLCLPISRFFLDDTQLAPLPVPPVEFGTPPSDIASDFQYHSVTVLPKPIGNLLDDSTLCALLPCSGGCAVRPFGRVTWEVMAYAFARTGSGVTGPLRGGTRRR